MSTSTLPTAAEAGGLPASGPPRPQGPRRGEVSPWAASPPTASSSWPA
ncbi:hypothetical protein ACFQV4_06140 [Streptomyces thermocarboxydus]